METRGRLRRTFDSLLSSISMETLGRLRRRREGKMVSYSSVPEEILIEILTRLPVKSLIRFKCVSKHWYAIITNPSFITTHLNHPNPKLCLLLKVPHNTITSSHGTMLLRNLTTFHDLDIPFINGSNKYVSVVGSCNGLVCVNLSREGTNIVLWNPAIRQFRHLPMPLFTNLKRQLTTVLGFGFSLNKEYKLVRMVKFVCKRKFKVLVEVFTESTGCWREINDVLPCETYEENHPVVVNGVLHRIANETLDLAKFILSFDMVTEVFHKTPLPCYENCNNCYNFICDALSVWKESLAMFVFSLGGGLSTHIAMWVMNGSGVGDCWSKLFTIGPFTIRPVFEPMKLMGTWNGHGVLLLSYSIDNDNDNDHELFLCDPISQEMKKLPTLGSKFYYGAYDYVESLVSVYTGNKVVK